MILHLLVPGFGTWTSSQYFLGSASAFERGLWAFITSLQARAVLGIPGRSFGALGVGMGAAWEEEGRGDDSRHSSGQDRTRLEGEEAQTACARCRGEEGLAGIWCLVCCLSILQSAMLAVESRTPENAAVEAPILER
jgi:hypothetical protein